MFGAIASTSGRGGLIIITFAYNAVIARLISPHHFGLVAMAMGVGGFLASLQGRGSFHCDNPAKYAWIARLCGWRVAKQAQFALPLLKTYLLRRWEYAMHKLEARGEVSL